MLERIGKYEIRGELGKGGFGQVYLGFDPTVGRLVAIKVLSAGGDSSMLIRFRTEASAAGNLHHKNIVTVHDFGEDRGMFFLVMEYLDGRDLQHVIANAGTLPLIEKMRIMSQVAEGLHCAHQGGVVHRDVKPANVMLLRDGVVKIMDFGIARLTGESSARLTQTGYLIGTISYMAPEQLRGGEADALCDIWAYGIIYYELLTGKNPFHGPDPASAMFRITSVEPEGVRSLSPACPEELENVIRRLLAKDRENRYQSLDDVLFDTAPILLELEKAQASGLISQATQLIGAGKLDDALLVVRKILDLEPMHREGRALREQLQKELRLRSVRGRIEALRQKAEKSAGDRNYAEAIQVLGSALQINPTDMVLQQRLKELEAAQEQRQRAERLLAQAQNELDLQNFTAAFQSATGALEAEPDNGIARELVARLGRTIAERDSEKQLREGLSKVKGLLVVESLDEAIALLDDLAKRAPDHPQVKELLARTSRQRAARERESRINAGLEGARNLIRSGDFAAAVSALESLAKEIPGENSIEETLNYAREELRTKERIAKGKALGNRAWALLQEKNFDLALETVREGLASYPENERLAHLREVILSTRAEHERTAAVQKALDECAVLQRAERFEDALNVVDAALREQPEHAVLHSLREELRRKADEQQRRQRAQAIQDTLAKARKMVEAGAPESATKLLQTETAKYPNEPALTSLLARARQEEERQRQERARNDLLNRAMTLEKDGNWTGALEIVEKGLQAHRSSVELADAAARLRSRISLDKDVRAIEVAISRQDAAGALKLLEDARQRHPDDATLRQLQQQAREQQRRTAVDEVCADVRREDSTERAMEILSAGLRRFPGESKLLALQSKLERRRNIDSVRQNLVAQDWAAAEARLRGLLQQDGSDLEARKLLEEVSREREAERHRRLREDGRQEAQRLLHDRRFEDAAARLRGLLNEFPGDPVLTDDLRIVMDAAQQYALSEAYRKGRQRASASLREQRFDAAISELQTLLAQFSGDAALQGDLAAAMAAKKGYEDRENCEKGSRKASELVSKRQFGAAIGILEALLGQFPGDPRLAEDLKSATGAKALFDQRQMLDQQVQQLEKLYRKGDAQAVKEQVALLGSGIHDPRLRELSEWADTEIVRVAQERERESAASLQKRRHLRVQIAGAVVGVASLAAATFWLVRSQPAGGRLELSAAEVSFQLKVGASTPASRTVSLKSLGKNKEWTSSSTDEWLSAGPQNGITPASITVSVNPATLSAGSHSGLLIFASDDQKASLRVKVTVEQKPETKPVEITEARPEVKTQQPSKTQQPVNKGKSTEHAAATKPDPGGQPDPVVARPAVEEPAKPTPAVVDCHAPSYHGLHKGTLRWVNGSLESNAILAFGGQIETIAGGRVTGNLLPGCDVTVTSDTSGIEIVGKPARETGFQRIRIQNKSNAPISNVILQWREK